MSLIRSSNLGYGHPKFVPLMTNAIRAMVRQVITCRSRPKAYPIKHATLRAISTIWTQTLKHNRNSAFHSPVDWSIRALSTIELLTITPLTLPQTWLMLKQTILTVSLQPYIFVIGLLTIASLTLISAVILTPNPILSPNPDSKFYHSPEPQSNHQS